MGRSGAPAWGVGVGGQESPEAVPGHLDRSSYPLSSVQILPRDGSVEHLLDLLEGGADLWAEGPPHSTDLEDPKEAEEGTKSLNTLCKRLSEDGTSRKVGTPPNRHNSFLNPTWVSSMWGTHRSRCTGSQMGTQVNIHVHIHICMCMVCRLACEQTGMCMHGTQARVTLMGCTYMYMYGT